MRSSDEHARESRRLLNFCRQSLSSPRSNVFCAHRLRLQRGLSAWGDLDLCCAEIHKALREELHKLEHKLDLFNAERRQRRNTTSLFCWNSWARVGNTLRAAKFGGTPEALKSVEWLNAYALLRSG